MPKQVVVIHGGNTFPSYDEYLSDLKNCPVSLDTFLAKVDWKGDLAGQLGPDYQVLQPRMPNKQNAQYQEWLIWFERILPFLKGEIILIGHSLGALFLIKYLSENQPPFTISKLILVAPPFNVAPTDTFRPIGNLKVIEERCPNIIIMHSADDPVVPIADARAYADALPSARLVILQDRAHLNQTSFPELLQAIKK